MYNFLVYNLLIPSTVYSLSPYNNVFEHTLPIYLIARDFNLYSLT
jgi:hypothetical protein